jgi:hypothetical protein
MKRRNLRKIVVPCEVHQDGVRVGQAPLEDIEGLDGGAMQGAVSVSRIAMLMSVVLWEAGRGYLTAL